MKNTSMPTETAQLLHFIKRRMEELEMTNVELAQVLDYKRPNVVSMMLTGSMKIPITKVPDLAKALQVDAMALLRMALLAYAPGLWETLEQVVDAERLVTANEFSLIKLVREFMGAVDVPFHEDVTFVAALLKLLERARARFLGPGSPRRQPRGPAP